MIEVVKNYELADGYTIVGGSSMGSATALYTALQNVSNYNFSIFAAKTLEASWRGEEWVWLEHLRLGRGRVEL